MEQTSLQGRRQELQTIPPKVRKISRPICNRQQNHQKRRTAEARKATKTINYRFTTFVFSFKSIAELLTCEQLSSLKLV